MAMFARLVLASYALAIGSIFCGAAAKAQSDNDYFFALVVYHDASVVIKNISDRTLLVDSYALTSENADLAQDQWLSIYDQFQNNPDYIKSVFGSDFPNPDLPWGDFVVPSPFTLGEILPLPLWPPSLTVPIGKPLGPDISTAKALVEGGGFEWLINDGTEINAPWPVIFVPEASTHSLLLIGTSILYISLRRKSAGNYWAVS